MQNYPATHLQIYLPVYITKSKKCKHCPRVSQQRPFNYVSKHQALWIKLFFRLHVWYTQSDSFPRSQVEASEYNYLVLSDISKTWHVTRHSHLDTVQEWTMSSIIPSDLPFRVQVVCDIALWCDNWLISESINLVQQKW